MERNSRYDIRPKVKTIKKGKTFNIQVNEKNFYYNNKKTLENIRHIIFFPNKDDIILTRYNGDNVEDSWITRKTLDSILDKLKDIKVLCEVKTQEGLFGNKK